MWHEWLNAFVFSLLFFLLFFCTPPATGRTIKKKKSVVCFLVESGEKYESSKESETQEKWEKGKTKSLIAHPNTSVPHSEMESPCSLYHREISQSLGRGACTLQAKISLPLLEESRNREEDKPWTTVAVGTLPFLRLFSRGCGVVQTWLQLCPLPIPSLRPTWRTTSWSTLTSNSNLCLPPNSSSRFTSNMMLWSAGVSRRFSYRNHLPRWTSS